MYWLRLLHRGLPVRRATTQPDDNRVYKCTLCVDRVVVGQEPACVKTCPTGAIHFGTKESMKTLAGERVAELKTRGYDNAVCTIQRVLAVRT